MSNPKQLYRALDHIKRIRELSLNQIELDRIAPTHVRYLAQQGVRLNALRLKTYKPARKYAIAVVTLAELKTELIDVIINNYLTYHNVVYTVWHKHLSALGYKSLTLSRNSSSFPWAVHI
jgi:hypothetical protein